jgi:hypothetical protein
LAALLPVFFTVAWQLSVPPFSTTMVPDWLLHENDCTVKAAEAKVERIVSTTIASIARVLILFFIFFLAWT